MKRNTSTPELCEAVCLALLFRTDVILSSIPQPRYRMPAYGAATVRMKRMTPAGSFPLMTGELVKTVNPDTHLPSLPDRRTRWRDELDFGKRLCHGCPSFNQHYAQPPHGGSHQVEKQ